MIDTLRQDPLYVKASPSERAAIETLLVYFRHFEEVSRNH